MSDFLWARKWTLRVASVTGTQTLVQILNGVVAFVLIRTLPKDEFAWFTLATGMAAVLSSLNDGGIATALTAQGGAVWQDRPRFSALLHAALSLLNRSAGVAAAVVSPILVWLLWQREAPSASITTSVLLVVGPQWLATRTVILGSVNRLHSRVHQLQSLEITGAFTRSAFTLIPAALGWVNLPVALGAVAASVLAQTILVRRQIRSLIDPFSPAKAQIPYRIRIQETMRRMYPNAVFTCIQGQLATSLLAIFGSTSQVADLGALARLGFVTNLIGAPLGHLFAPAFARCQDLRRLRRIFLSVLVGYTFLLSLFLLAVSTQSDLILSVFGPKYAHLKTELFLMSISLSLTMLGHVFWALNTAKAWVRLLWLNIPFTLAAQITTPFFIPIQTTAGAIQLSIWTVLPSLILGVFVATSNLIRGDKQTSA
jgi:hypothetical protein